MSLDIEQLIDTYVTLKEYIPSKDRQAAADHVFSLMSDSGLSEQDLRILAGADSYMQRASLEYLDPEEDEDAEETDYNYDED